MKKKQTQTTARQIPAQNAFHQHIYKLLHGRQTCEAALTTLAILQDLIESLPLPTNVYGVAQCRLGSAHRYLRHGEIGAARYELRLLDGSIRQQLS